MCVWKEAQGKGYQQKAVMPRGSAYRIHTIAMENRICQKLMFRIPFTKSQMQTTMQTLGYDNVFIGTVEGEPEDTSCEAVIEAVKAAGYTKVILRPLMVVAGDHANNDMAGEDADSWLSQFTAAGCFESVDCQISGLGRIADVQQLYIAHTKAAMDLLNG